MEHSLFFTTWLPILLLWFVIFAQNSRKKKVKTLILMGNTAKKIELAVKNDDSYDEHNIKIFNVSNMEEAVDMAQKVATNGDIVFFSLCFFAYSN